MPETNPDWLTGYFWCDQCSRLCPKLSWWKDMWTDSVTVLGEEFRAGKCQFCGNIKLERIIRGDG